jgi:hypothetical protein
MDFILLEPPTYSARNCVVSAAGEKRWFNVINASRSSARSLGSTDAMLRRIPSPSAIVVSLGDYAFDAGAFLLGSFSPAFLRASLPFATTEWKHMAMNPE